MREMDAPTVPPKPDLAPGGWLHFDVSFGCAGNMLVAALLDLGLPVEKLREGLRDAGLGALDARVQSDRRHGVGGLHLDFVDESGHPIDGAFQVEHGRNKKASTRGRRHPTPHLARPDKTDPSKTGAAAPQAAPIPGSAPEVATGAPTFAPPMEGQNDGNTSPAMETNTVVPDPITTWLESTEVSAADVTAFLRKSRMQPLAKAMCQKALRRALSALSHVKRVEPEELTLDGKGAVDLLADIVSFACLLEYLSPARVTSSALGISNAPVRIGGAKTPGPSPWVLGVLEGLPAREVEADFETTTPTGATLLWSVAHRSGPRGDVIVGHSGVGLGTHNPRSHANICRAMYGPAPSVKTLSGQPRAEDVQRLIALLGPDADIPQLRQQLTQHGASSISWNSRHRPDGETCIEFSCAVPAEQVEEATEALYIIGCADEVMSVAATRSAPAQNVVTVRIGTGKKKPTVQVVERIFRDGRRTGHPVETDVRKAARTLDLSIGQARTMAFSEWSARGDNQTRQRYDGDEVMK